MRNSLRSRGRRSLRPGSHAFSTCLQPPGGQPVITHCSHGGSTTEKTQQTLSGSECGRQNHSGELLWQGTGRRCVSWEGGADLVGNNTGGRLNAMYTAAQQQHLSRPVKSLHSTALI